jgi:hypothetical protein
MIPESSPGFNYCEEGMIIAAKELKGMCRLPSKFWFFPRLVDFVKCF